MSPFASYKAHNAKGRPVNCGVEQCLRKREGEGMAMDLATLLREAREHAPEGEVVVRIHLFGIQYAHELDGVNLRGLVKTAGIPTPYATEIRKGMRLADYVTLK
jgi:hypothetical protein